MAGRERQGGVTELYHQGEKVSRVLEKREKSLPNHPLPAAAPAGGPHNSYIFAMNTHVRSALYSALHVTQHTPSTHAHVMNRARSPHSLHTYRPRLCGPDTQSNPIQPLTGRPHHTPQQRLAHRGHAPPACKTTGNPFALSLNAPIMHGLRDPSRLRTTSCMSLTGEPRGSAGP